MLIPNMPLFFLNDIFVIFYRFLFSFVRKKQRKTATSHVSPHPLPGQVRLGWVDFDAIYITNAVFKADSTYTK